MRLYIKANSSEDSIREYTQNIIEEYSKNIDYDIHVYDRRSYAKVEITLSDFNFPGFLVEDTNRLSYKVTCIDTGISAYTTLEYRISFDYDITSGEIEYYDDLVLALKSNQHRVEQIIKNISQYDEYVNKLEAIKDRLESDLPGVTITIYPGTVNPVSDLIKTMPRMKCSISINNVWAHDITLTYDIFNTSYGAILGRLAKCIFDKFDRQTRKLVDLE